MNFRTLRNSAALAVLLGIALTCATPAQATIILGVSNTSAEPPGTTFAGVNNPVGSSVAINGYTGLAPYTVSATGTSINVPGSAAQMDLSTFSISSSTTGTLYLSITDTNFTLGSGAILANLVSSLTGSFTGGSAGTVEFKAWANSSNVAFGTTGPLMTDITTLPGSATSSGLLSNPFSITEQLAITFTKLGTGGLATFSGDANTFVTNVPEPSTLLAAMAGLPLALVGLRRSMRRKTA